MRYYETAFLIAPDIPEEENQQLISQMSDVVQKNKGKMIHVDEWGKRKLAYPINKHDSAFYVFFTYEGIPETYAELERQFKQKESIIRYLTLRKEEEPSVKKEAEKKPKKEKPKKEEPEKEKPEKTAKKEEKKTPAKDKSEAPTKKEKEEKKETTKTKKGEK